MIKNTLYKYYGLNAESAEKSSAGAGSDTYFVACPEGKYVIKYPSQSEMNNPELEPKLCEFLLGKGIRVSEFIRNVNGEFISVDESGRMFHVQRFVEGKMFQWNEAPSWLLREAARTLGKIHAALTDYTGLPTGIGHDFFRYMTPDSALSSYKKTLAIARANGDTESERELLYRIALIGRFPKYDIDVSRLTCRSTHGDYFISQLICGENDINAVIDWTTACVHPVVWEITRSYVYAAPECAGGIIDTDNFITYVRDYLSYAPLNDYDIGMLVKLFYYQIAVCDYYNQYYQSTAANRDIYLRQAVFSTKLMMWLENNVNRLTDALTVALAHG